MEYTLPWARLELTTLVICTNCIDSCTPNYHTITTISAPCGSMKGCGYKLSNVTFSKGTLILLLYPHTLKWMWNDTWPAVDQYSFYFLPINATSGQLYRLDVFILGSSTKKKCTGGVILRVPLLLYPRRRPRKFITCVWSIVYNCWTIKYV